jgi:hypothetical protein
VREDDAAGRSDPWWAVGPWWSVAGWAERLSGFPARLSFPIVMAAQGALIGTIGLYWDAGVTHMASTAIGRSRTC